MQLTVNKICSLILLCICFSISACSQSETQKNEQFNKYSVKAYELRKKGDLQSAITEQKKAVALKPKDWESLTVLAGLYLDLYDQNKKKENLEQARELLLKALKINPNDAVGHEMLAGTYDRLGNKTKALEETEKVNILKPNDIENLTNLAINQYDLKSLDISRKTFEKVLQRNPNYAYALYYYAELELETGNREKAIELFERGSKASATDNDGDTKYIDINRQRLGELKSEKAKTASPK